MVLWYLVDTSALLTSFQPLVLKSLRMLVEVGQYRERVLQPDQDRKEIMALCCPPVPKVPLKGVPAIFHSVLPWYSLSL